MNNFFTLLCLFSVIFLTSCNKDEENTTPKNDVISFSVTGPGLENYEFKTNGILGKLPGLSLTLGGVATITTQIQDNDIKCALGFISDSAGTYPFVENNIFDISNPNKANMIVEFTNNGILYELHSVSGSMVVNNVDVTPIAGAPGTGLASGDGTFSGTFVTFDNRGEILGTYQVTKGVFKFSKG